MNKIILMGRLTGEPEIRYTQGDDPMAIARYSLAVDKRQKREDGITADFFRVVAFHYAADFAAKYFHKGTKILLTGHVQTGTYDNKDGVRMPFFEVVAEEQEFAESKNANQNTAGNDKGSNPAGQDGFMNLPDDMDELPFD
jgi:single-strand DNA-binding protein